MIDFYSLVFERSKKFYITLGFLALLIAGLVGFAVYRHVDKTPYLSASIALYDALNISDVSESKEALYRIVNRKIEPYSSIAAMQLARLLNSQAEAEKKSEMYKYASFNTNSVYVRGLAQLNVQISDGNIDSHSVYSFTAQFLDAYMRSVKGNKFDEIPASLNNVVAAIDSNPYIKDLSSKLLKAISEQ